MSDTPSRVALITGGNSGIGFATARKLAAKGFHVIMASRNQQTSAQAIARLRASNPDASVESIPLDLASFAAVRQCAAAFQAKGYPRLRRGFVGSGRSQGRLGQLEIGEVRQ